MSSDEGTLMKFLVSLAIRLIKRSKVLIEEWLSGLFLNSVIKFETFRELRNSFNKSLDFFVFVFVCLLFLLNCCYLYWSFSYYFRYHPDKNPNDPVAADMFKEITFAYDVLADPENRRQYDTTGSEVRFHTNLEFNFDVWLKHWRE